MLKPASTRPPTSRSTGYGLESGARLAELNALYLDLDPYLLPPGDPINPGSGS